MDTKEQWEIWKPVAGLAPQYSIELLERSGRGFFIVLRNVDNNAQKVTMTFDMDQDVYEQLYGSFRERTIIEIEKQLGKDFCKTWSFFQVHNSVYKAWILEEELDGVANMDIWMHMAIVGQNSIVYFLITPYREFTFTFSEDL